MIDSLDIKNIKYNGIKMISVESVDDSKCNCYKNVKLLIWYDSVTIL